MSTEIRTDYMLPKKLAGMAGISEAHLRNFIAANPDRVPVRYCLSLAMYSWTDFQAALTPDPQSKPASRCRK